MNATKEWTSATLSTVIELPLQPEENKLIDYLLELISGSNSIRYITIVRTLLTVFAAKTNGQKRPQVPTSESVPLPVREEIVETANLTDLSSVSDESTEEKSEKVEKLFSDSETNTEICDVVTKTTQTNYSEQSLGCQTDDQKEIDVADIENIEERESSKCSKSSDIEPEAPPDVSKVSKSHAFFQENFHEVNQMKKGANQRSDGKSQKAVNENDQIIKPFCSTRPVGKSRTPPKRLPVFKVPPEPKRRKKSSDEDEDFEPERILKSKVAKKPTKNTF